MQAILSISKAAFAACQSAAMGSFPTAVRSVVYSQGPLHEALAGRVVDLLEYDVISDKQFVSSRVDKCLTRFTSVDGINSKPGRFINIKPEEEYPWVTFALPAGSGANVVVATAWESYTVEDGLALSVAQSTDLLVYAENLASLAFFLKYSKELPVNGRCSRTRAQAAHGLDYLSMSDYPTPMNRYQFEFGLDEVFHARSVDNVVLKTRVIRTTSTQWSFGVKIPVKSKVAAFEVRSSSQDLIMNVAGVVVDVRKGNERWIVLPVKDWNGVTGLITFGLLPPTGGGLDVIVRTREYHFPPDRE